jgi:hypothetical protein
LLAGRQTVERPQREDPRDSPVVHSSSFLNNEDLSVPGERKAWGLQQNNIWELGTK